MGESGNNWNAAGYRRVRDYCEANALTPWQALDRLSDGTLKIPHTGNIVLAFKEIVAELQQLEALPDLAAVIDHLLPAGDDSVRDLRDLAVDALNEVGGEDRAEWLFELMEAISAPEIPSEIEDVENYEPSQEQGAQCSSNNYCGVRRRVASKTAR